MTTRRLTTIVWLAIAAWIGASSASAAPVVFTDGAGDSELRRTDDNADGPFDPQMQAQPDLLEVRIESFAPTAPHVDPFVGQGDANGLYIRIDVSFAGLVNPPGPVGYDSHWPTYAPDIYGPNPVHGFIEFDIDGNENTGGEIENPELRYLGNVARFGGYPSEARFAGRVATGDDSFDGNLWTGPFYEASGEEFHLVLLGEEVEQVDVMVESPGGNPQVFEAGETWWVVGDFFHKAHAYDRYAVLCSSGSGDYEPEVTIQFAHDEQADVTTVSLVFPKRNEGAARLISPSTNVQNRDGCDNNQFSIEEVLYDLHFGAAFADAETRLESEFQFIAEWEFQGTETFDTFLDPSGWRIQGVVGTAYLPVQADDDELIWTDVYPNAAFGDMNGDGVVDGADSMAVLDFIADHDGEFGFDTDGDAANQSLSVFDWGRRFSLYDVNYDGLVDAMDTGGPVLVGDMNLDGVIDGRDVAPFTLALTDAIAYGLQFPGANAEVIGDADGNGVFDIDDVGAFLVLLLGAPPEPLLGDMNVDGVVSLDDIPGFCLGLTKPAVYQNTFGDNPNIRGDLNGDGLMDSGDIAHFVERLVTP